MKANKNKSYLIYFNNFVDGYNNTYHRCAGKIHINYNYSPLSGKIEKSPLAYRFKVGDRVRIADHLNIFLKVTLKISQKKYLLLVLF